MAEEGAAGRKFERVGGVGVACGEAEGGWRQSDGGVRRGKGQGETGDRGCGGRKQETGGEKVRWEARVEKKRHVTRTVRTQEAGYSQEAEVGHRMQEE